MRFGRVLGGIVLVLLLVAIVVGVGWSAFNAGLMQGMVIGGAQALPPAEGTAPTVPNPMPWRFVGPWGGQPFGLGWGFHPFGFGLLGCLVPFLFFLLILALLRLAFGGPRHFGGWGGPWARGGPGWAAGQGEIPPAVRELHRKLHETDVENRPPAPASAPPSGT